MKARGYLISLLAIAILITVASIMVWARTSSYVRRTDYNQILIGMPIADVERILGPPVADVGPMIYEDLHSDESGVFLYVPFQKLVFWDDNVHMITLTLDTQGRIATKSFSRHPYVGPVRRVSDWLGF